MDNLTQRALLLDFYGSLLTEKQKKIYDLYFQQDLSLGEISQNQGVSRPAVYDLLKRTEEALQHYEDKLGLVQKYVTSREIRQELSKRLGELRERLKRNNLEDDWEKLAALLKKLEDSW